MSAYGTWEQWRERRKKNGGATVGWGGGPPIMPDSHPWKAAHLVQMWDPPPRRQFISIAAVAQKIAERRAG